MFSSGAAVPCSQLFRFISAVCHLAAELKNQIMEGNLSSSIRPTDLLAKIRDFTRSLVKPLSDGRSPAIFIDKFSNYCSHPHGNCCCGSDMPEGQEILTIQRECHTHRIDVLLRVLLIVQKLLQENRHGSKRDIYYMHPSVFSEQSIVDRAINDICILLQCSRHNLNVVSVANGLVMGWVRFVEAGRKFDCINSLCTAIPIPVYVEEVTGICYINFRHAEIQLVRSFHVNSFCLTSIVSFLCFKTKVIQ
ncbi:Meiotic recombination protein SPO11-1 [Linum grandiflorum]